MRRITTTGSYPFYQFETSSFSAKPGSSFPPFNIIQNSDDEFDVEVAVAGYSREELTVSQDGEYLIISGIKEKQDPEKNYYHKGIAERNFEKKIKLLKDTEITNAKLDNGILEISLKVKRDEEIRKTFEIS